MPKIGRCLIRLKDPRFKQSAKHLRPTVPLMRAAASLSVRAAADTMPAWITPLGDGLELRQAMKRPFPIVRLKA
jgi:hypothetical protein